MAWVGCRAWWLRQCSFEEAFVSKIFIQGVISREQQGHNKAVKFRALVTAQHQEYIRVQAGLRRGGVDKKEPGKSVNH
jgi:hypothetical protein